MSYQVLARKWRPANFTEMVGQSHVLRTLSSALDNDRLHHAYLFTGTRGVGKTTIARIFARCLNCEQGVSSKPCGTCSACTEITEGRFVDLIEVDAASRTKVEDTRELLDNVQYRPTRGRYKVYLIDEVHMLSRHSFNALLKTLEEPPPHVVFLLATTDPQKLPATVLSRCLQFNLKNMQPKMISKHLAYILGAETIEFEQSALESLAWSAKGSMRDALSLLDQAIAFGDGKVTDLDVSEMLGTIDKEQVYQILAALAENDGLKCMAIIEDLSQFAPDYEELLAELLRLLHQVALLQQVPDASVATQHLPQIKKLAQSIPAEDIQLFYQLALHGRRDLPLAPDGRSGFEMCLLRLMHFRPATRGGGPVKKSLSSSHPIEQSVDTLKHVTSASNANTGSKTVLNPVTKDVETTVTANDYTDVLRSPLRRSQPEAEAESEADPEAESDPESESESDPVSIPVAKLQTDTKLVSESDSSAQSVEDNALTTSETQTASETLQLPAVSDINRSNWHIVIELLNIGGVSQQIALNSQFINFDGENFEISLANHIRSMVHNEQINKLTAAISALYNSSYTLSISDREPDFETPKQRKEKIRQQRHQTAYDHLTNDPHVQSLLKTFDTSLDERSVETFAPKQH